MNGEQRARRWLGAAAVPALGIGLLVGGAWAARPETGTPAEPAGAVLLELEINPESRVKVARVGALPELVPGRWRPCVLRVRNTCGTTAPLQVEDASAPLPASPGALRWRLEPDARAGSRLSGAEVEYRVLSFTAPALARASGRRTASLRFHVGQGTQDLGFRGEVDLPFRVHAEAGGSGPRNTPSEAGGQARTGAEAAAGEPAGPATPPRVEAQPLLAHARRVREALELLGEPLSAERLARLERAAREAHEAPEAAAALVQQALDPLCLAELTVRPDGTLAAARGASPRVLHEQGWRTFLVKVRNEAGASGTLRVTSPSARPVPNGPAGQVASRWMDLHVVETQPLGTALSGLPLEYRPVQVYARDAGSLHAVLSFNVGAMPAAADGRPRPVLVREWRFPRDATAWKPLNQCRLEPRGEGLRVVSTGVDPYLAADVSAPGGRMVLRFRARAERPGFGQVFWWTEERPQPDGRRSQVFSLEEDGGAFREYAVRFTAEGSLMGIRLDPCGAPGWVDLQSVTLSYEDEPGRHSASLSLPFTSRASRPVTLRVRDELGRPATACFLVRDEQGRVYPSQAKRLAPDFFFHPQVYRADGETLRLPAGRYTVRCSRGPESVPEVRTLEVGRGPARIDYRVRRWIDPARNGWYSGDHHIHGAGCAHYVNPTEGVRPEDMARHCRGEDLKVGASLTWGPCFDYQKRFFTGRPDQYSRFPYLLRYDVEVSGFGSHQSGHLCLLRLKEQIYPGGRSKDHWPTLGLTTLRWAKRQGAVCGPAHSALGLAPTQERVPGPDGPGGLPSYAIPAYDGIGANEFIMNVTHRVPGPDGTPVPAVDFLSTMDTDRTAELNMWYHVLNCGFRTRISGETDFPCISGERVGLGRVYAKLPGRLTYDAWCEAIRKGRSYVSDGSHHLLDFRAVTPDAPAHRAEVGAGESELRLPRPGTVRVRVRAAARDPKGDAAPVELVVNGYPVARRMLPRDGQARDLVFETRVERSSWLAVRMFPGAHTNPIWAVVADQPVRASRRSAEWCLRGVEQCWKQKQRTYAPVEQEEARLAYDHAREVYRRIQSEAAAD